MDDFLRPVKTVKNVRSNIEKFESLATRETKGLRSKEIVPGVEANLEDEPPLSISEQHRTARTDPISKSRTELVKSAHPDARAFLEQSYLCPSPTSAHDGISTSTLPDNARRILKSRPGHEELIAVLQYLRFGLDGQHDFDVRRTNPQAAQIINVLVTVTIPDVWPTVSQKNVSKEEAKMQKTLLCCLSCVAGIGSLLAQIKHLSSPARTNDILLYDALTILGEILEGRKLVLNKLQESQRMYQDELRRKLFWQDMTALIAGSRILSVTTQAHQLVGEGLQSHAWLVNGTDYTKWLARNITYAAIKLNTNTEESWKVLGQLVRRGLSLGYRDAFVAEIYTELLLGPRALWTPVHLIMQQLAPHEQKAFFDAIICHLAREHLVSAGGLSIAYSRDTVTQQRISGAAALVAGLVKNNDVLEQHLEAWLLAAERSQVTIGLSSRRALVAALGRSEVKLQRVLEKSLAIFGDKVRIQHSSILEQEATAQTILLVIGHLKQVNLSLLKSPPISTLTMHAVSNRLAATLSRTHLLGMVVATAISKLVDKPENMIDFEVKEMETEDVKTWLELVSLNDSIGDITDLQHTTPALSHTIARRETDYKTEARMQPFQSSKIVAIEEVSSANESEDDLVPYQKPESDPEDEEEDPTLINRSKPSIAVYISDLIKQLQTNDKPDIVALALKTAPDLIRRKASFGTELTENVHNLVTILVNLQEGMSEPELQELRLDSLKACVIAKPDLVGRSLAEVYFQGDFSLSQRAVILIATGLAARELAGFKDGQPSTELDSFPSKRLPSHLASQAQPSLTITNNMVASLADNAARQMIRPMALTAADKMTGPSVLKVRTFSSRMEVEKKTRERLDLRTKNVPKNLAKLLTETIYNPFCSRMGILLSHTVRGRLPNTTIFHSSTMKLLLQTLSLVLHTIGPQAGLQLPILTHETLFLLLGLHSATRLSTDPAVLPALLHLLLTLLDITIEAGITAQERLMTDHGAQIVELVSWSNGLSNQIAVPDAEASDGGISWTILAAGIQVKWFEIGKRFQGRLLGLSVDEMDQLAGA